MLGEGLSWFFQSHREPLSQYLDLVNSCLSNDKCTKGFREINKNINLKLVHILKDLRMEVSSIKYTHIESILNILFNDLTHIN